MQLPARMEIQVGARSARWCPQGLKVTTFPLLRVRGGFVVVERIPRDSAGKIMINLEKFDDNVVAMRTFSAKEKYSQPNGNKTTNI